MLDPFVVLKGHHTVMLIVAKYSFLNAKICGSGETCPFSMITKNTINV